MASPDTEINEPELAERPCAASPTEWTLLGDELVVLHESTGTVHRLNATAAAVWLMSDGATSVTEMADLLRSSAPVERQAHVASASQVALAVSELRHANLLRSQELDTLSGRPTTLRR